MTKNFRSLFFGFILLLTISSCTPLKDIVYLQETIATADTATIEPPVYKIQPNDYIYIKFITSDEESGRYLNGLTGSTGSVSMNSEFSILMNSFKVNTNGFIDLPGVGELQVKGKSLQKIEDLIKNKIAKYLEDATVIVKQVNKTFTVIGEASNPGTYGFNKDNLTIFEALGYASDLTDYSNRHTVKVIRHIDNKRKLIELDLTDINVINSPFYYILPNDVIYVEPKNSLLGTKSFPISLTITALNSAILIYKLF